MRQMVRMEALTKAKKGFKDLLKQWNLPPADADQFLQFVADRDSADSSDALSMLATGKLDEKSIAEQEQRQAKAKEESNARLKSLLGDERYAQFEAANARREQLQAVSSYRDHLESAGAPLTNEQRDALAKIVMTEKPDENDWHQEDVEFFTQGMTDAQLAKIRQRQEAAQARIAQQSADFLSPDQVSALQAAFRAELEEQDLALKLARKPLPGRCRSTGREVIPRCGPAAALTVPRFFLPKSAERSERRTSFGKRVLRMLHERPIFSVCCHQPRLISLNHVKNRRQRGSTNQINQLRNSPNLNPQGSTIAFASSL
jgi:hypothetical protein